MCDAAAVRWFTGSSCRSPPGREAQASPAGRRRATVTFSAADLTPRVALRISHDRTRTSHAAPRPGSIHIRRGLNRRPEAPVATEANVERATGRATLTPTSVGAP